MNEIGSIYTFTNLLNGNRYVGFTSNIKDRLKSHKSSFKNGKKTILYDAMRSYGWDNFSFEIIYQSTDLYHCKEVMENHFIIEYRSFVKFVDCRGYNMTLGGDGIGKGTTPWNKGISSESLKWTETRKENHIKTQKEIWNSEKKRELSNVWTEEKRLEHQIKQKESWTKKMENGYIVNTYPSKMVLTPDGVFSSIKECSRKTGLRINTIKNRATRQIKGYSYIEESTT